MSQSRVDALKKTLKQRLPTAEEKEISQCVCELCRHYEPQPYAPCRVSMCKDKSHFRQKKEGIEFLIRMDSVIEDAKLRIGG